jgi:hypothetical protein
MLLENDGKETLQTILKKVAFKLNDVGMVTDAVWVDNDSKKDLLVVGDWMAPKIFKNTGRRLPNINLTYGISGVLECS